LKVSFSEFPELCTKQHLDRIIHNIEKFNETLNFQNAEITNFSVVNYGHCAICAISSPENLMCLATVVMGMHVWTPAICIDMETCSYREAVKSERPPWTSTQT